MRIAFVCLSPRLDFRVVLGFRSWALGCRVSLFRVYSLVQSFEISVFGSVFEFEISVFPAAAF